MEERLTATVRQGQQIQAVVVAVVASRLVLVCLAALVARAS